MTDLIPIEKANSIELFKEGGLDPLLNKITEEAKKLADGLSVDYVKDRKEIASIAYKISRSKTTIDAARKNLVSDLKKQSKLIDEEGKKARDYLDTLRDEIRNPLNQWEHHEEQRILKHNQEIEIIKKHGELCVDWMSYSVDGLRDVMNTLKSVDVSEFEEFSEQAQKAISESITIIAESIDKRRDYDQEQAELERLRQEAAERERQEAEAKAKQDRKDREEQIRKEAAEAENHKAEERQRKLREQKEQEERRRIAAEERLKLQKEESERRIKQEQIAAEEREKAAIEKERRLQAERKAAEEEAQRKRETNKRHLAKINREAVASIIRVAGQNENDAKAIVIAIAKGEIDHISINY